MATLNPGVAPDLTEEQVQPYLPPQPQLVPVGNTYKTSSVTGNLIPRDTYMQGIAALQDYQTKNRAIQEQELAQLQASAAALKQKELPVDLSALAALSDTWFGGNLAKSMQPKETAASRQDQLQQMNELISKARGKISDQDVELLKTQLSGEARKDETEQRLAMQKLLAEDKNAIAQEKRDQKNEDKIDKQVTAISTRTAPMAKITTNFQKVDEILKKYPEGSDVPGVGMDKVMGISVPAKMIPQAFLAEDAVELRKNAEALKSNVIQMISGTAAGEKEVARIESQTGTGWMDNPKTLRIGMEQLRDSMKAAQKEVEAGYLPEARQKHELQGGISSRVFDTYTFGKDKGPKVGDIKKGKSGSYIFKGGDQYDQKNWVPLASE